jgi:PIN domain nuclease of toxin-antitoxin system
MTLLLDTCTFIWLTQEPGKLSATAQPAIDDSGNRLFLSHVSAWEMHLKHQAGKLFLPASPRQWIAQQLAAWKAAELPIELNAIHRTSDLPDIHRDPFDRLLAAQALEASLTIVSPDAPLSLLGAARIW